MSKFLRKARLGIVSPRAKEFTSSLRQDREIAQAVIEINRAHVTMLCEKRIISNTIAAKILDTLQAVTVEQLTKSDSEDVHAALEEYVSKKLGEQVAGNIHLAKSRNDQAATAIRMRLRLEIIELLKRITSLQRALLARAEKELDTIIPSYTHLQIAQPITFAHYLSAFIQQLQRNSQRFWEALTRVNMSPMGAGAVAGTSIPIDRNRVAELLGFKGIIENSMDAVGSRDFLTETLSAATILTVDLSRLAEDIIIWSSAEFNLVELPDSFAFTSSIMPQKKNPDVLEIIRAQAGRMIGELTAAFAMLKATPSGYNLDLQEITPLTWDSLRRVGSSLEILAPLLLELSVKKDQTDRLRSSFAGATELANVLVKEYGIPFRTSHQVVATVVRRLIQMKASFSDLSADLLEEIARTVTGRHIRFSERALASVKDPRRIVAASRAFGGPAKTSVARMLRNSRGGALKLESVVNRFESDLSKSRALMRSAIGKILQG